MRSSAGIIRLAFLTALGASIAVGADLPGNNVPENYVEQRREFMRLLTEGQNEQAYLAIQSAAARKLTPLQQARLADAAWPFYPDPSKWAPLLEAEAGAAAAAPP